MGLAQRAHAHNRNQLPANNQADADPARHGTKGS
ncbi:MAG: hypothetical protein ACJAVR_003852 [Paracoccaceae bacterium]